MDAFTVHTGRIAVYDADQVDTDRIIPARFLSRVERSGYGELLFKDVRAEDFPLDRPDAAGASVLVVGTNFGCGSSREHAVWAIQQAGYRAVIGRRTAETAGFSDIFRSNAGNCGLCLVDLDEEAHAALVAAGSGAEATVDLERQEVRLGDKALPFTMNPGTREQLLAGLDLIGTTLVHESAIGAKEASWDSFRPPDGAVERRQPSE